MMGVGPLVAIATNKFAMLASVLTAGYKYWKAGLLKGEKLLIWLALANFVGAVIGTNLVLQLDEELLKRIVIGLLVGVLILMIVVRDLGLKRREIPLA